MTTSTPPRSARPQRLPRTSRPVRVWDVVLTIVLLVAVLGVAALASYFGVFLAFASDGCGGPSCNIGLLEFGFWFAVIGPWVVWAAALIGGVVLLVLRRLAFWVPLAAAALMGVCFFVGLALVGAAVGW